MLRRIAEIRAFVPQSFELEILTEDLLTAPQAMDAQIASWEGKDGEVWGQVYRLPAGYRVILPGFCSFEFDHLGGHPRCGIFAGTDEFDARHLFEVNIVPLILGLKGHSVFHASCVRVGSTGVVFLGASGQGKSTLTASFALNGYPFLADDVLVVDPATPPVAHSDTNAIRLWATSVEGLFPKGHFSEPYVTYSRKRRVSGDTKLAHAPGTAQVAAAFVLGEVTDGAVRIRRLQGAAVHWHWMNNMFVLDAKREDVMPHLFDAAARIASEVPTYVIEYPRDFDRLPEVRQSIVDTLKCVRQ